MIPYCSLIDLVYVFYVIFFTEYPLRFRIVRNEIKTEVLNMKILIIDDQMLFAEGMKYFLESLNSTFETSIQRDAESGLNAIINGYQADLILLNINLTGIYNYCLIDQLSKVKNIVPVLIVSAVESPSAIGMAIEKGASGFITKSSDKEEFVKAIQTILSGETYLPDSKGTFSDTERKEFEGLSRVTSRQHEILNLLSQGLLNKQIAYELCISANTVKAHIHDLFRHLNVSNRTAAVKNAQKYGLI